MLHDIEVRGVTSLDPVEVKREVYAVIDARPRPIWQPARQLWFLPVEDIRSRLQARLMVKSITVDKTSYNVLRLTVEEGTKQFILKTPTQVFWVDTKGVIKQEVSSKDLKNMETNLNGKLTSNVSDTPVFSIDNQTILQPGQQISAQTIKTWLNVAAQLQKQGIRYREIKPDAAASSTKISVKTLSGYAVWFDTSSGTLKTQIEAYRAFEKQKSKDLQIHEYVDVRIPGRVYVR